MAMQKKKDLGLSPRGKTGDWALYCAFFLSLLIHVLSLLPQDRSAPRPCIEQRMKVDLVTLRVSLPQRQMKEIPRPYMRSREFPQPRCAVSQSRFAVSQSRFAVSQSRSAMAQPRFAISQPRYTESQPQAASLQSAKPKAMGFTGNSPDAGAGVYVPLPDSLRSAGEAMAGRVAENAAALTADVSISSLPLKIESSAREGHDRSDRPGHLNPHDRFDPARAFQVYEGKVRRHIAVHQKFPSLARKKGWEGSVNVGFLLYRDGRVGKVRITGSSSIAFLDEAAIQTVKDGDPFPPFPESIRESSLWFEIPLVFELRQR
ncbi:MAG: energy transducer TonB [bacterium]